VPTNGSLAATLRSLEDLPALSAVVQKLLVLLRDPDFSADEVCATIGTDQALTTRVLRLVNSPAYGLSRDIASIDRAVVILGSEALQNLVLCAGVAQTIESYGSPSSFVAYWRHALHVGHGARLLALRTGLAAPENAFLAGLVHDIGELALAVVRPAEWQRILDLGSHERLANEKHYLGLTHQRAGYVLLSQWCLPDDVCEVARNHHLARLATARERPLIMLVALADVLARLAGAGAEIPVPERNLGRLLRALALSPADLFDVLRDLDRRQADQEAFLDLPTAQSARSRATVGPLTVALIGTGKRRLEWLVQVLRYHDHDVIGLRTFFEDPARADLVILDPASLSRAQIERAAPFLVRSSAAVALCGRTDGDLVEAVLGPGTPALDLDFSPQELSAVSALGARAPARS
jgi:HD-like signal output (HDOD) protein